MKGVLVMILEVGAINIDVTEKEMNFSKGVARKFAGEIGTIVQIHQSIQNIDRRQGYELGE